MARTYLACGVLSVSLLPASTLSAGASGRPVAVSPGHAAEVARVESRCPTFSWGSVAGAHAYEFVLYRLGAADERLEPVLRRSFPGSASSWTPALESCLERGERYAWSIGARGPQDAAEWSAPSLFEVASAVSEAEFQEALAVVERYLRGSQPQAEIAGDPGSHATARVEDGGAASGPAPGTVPSSGRQALVASGDSCCDGALPSNYAVRLINDSLGGDPDALALEFSARGASSSGMNYVGFFDGDAAGGPRLVGEIEATANGGVHFTGSASLRGVEEGPIRSIFCEPLQTCVNEAFCPAGKKVLGGQLFVGQASYDVRVLENSKLTSQDGWRVKVSNLSSFSYFTFAAGAICADVNY